MTTTGLIEYASGQLGCWWAGADDHYQHYHDAEWGRPVVDDQRLFEKICLEGFQSGLSWLTILRKRDNFRAAFHNFDPATVARFREADVLRLLDNAGIVRHRGKIEAAINNAQALDRIIESYGSLAALVWSFEPDSAERPAVVDFAAVQQLATSPASSALSKELKRNGFRFVGPTTAYAFMQSMGVVNDHLEGCWCREEVEVERAALVRPSSRKE